ncbi:MAG: HD-GYP domain-containing protein [Deltaproteobacteria bacterium]|nr:HD-GYP domain-containing protein [Deltaproteobacteria bacterium]
MPDRDSILKTINAALKSRKLYPPGHPAIITPAKKTVELLLDAFKEKPTLTFGIVNEALIFESNPVSDADKLYPELLGYMSVKGVDTVIFERGMGDKEFTGLIDVLTSNVTLKASDLQKDMHQRGITHITLKSIPMGKKSILEVYNGAVDTVKNVMNDVRLGKIPASEPVNHVIDELSESVLTDQNAIIGLTMIKNYDNYLFNHSVNVSIIAISLAKAMNLESDELHAVGIGALLHDIGKTGVAENIIRKPGGLSSEEWEKIKEHPLLGSNIIKRMEGLHEIVGKLIYEHHIRYDHSGYPQSTIKLHPLTQIITISDAYDALTTLRVYQQPHTPVEAVKVMQNFSGRHFNPDILNVFVSMIGAFPVGTLVRLSTNEVGVVTAVNKDAQDRPTLKAVYGPDGTALPDPVEVDLVKTTGKSIISTVNPATLDFDIAAFFEHEAALQAEL